MKKFFVFTVLLLFFFVGNAHAQPQLLRNATREDVTSGAMVVSPSKSNPDYFYHWIRDASLVMAPLYEPLHSSDLPKIHWSKEMKRMLRAHLYDSSLPTSSVIKVEELALRFHRGWC